MLLLYLLLLYLLLLLLWLLLLYLLLLYLLLLLLLLLLLRRVADRIVVAVVNGCCSIGGFPKKTSMSDLHKSLQISYMAG